MLTAHPTFCSAFCVCGSDYMITQGSISGRKTDGRIPIPHQELFRIARVGQIEPIMMSATV
jgi:hypothetical protein